MNKAVITILVLAAGSLTVPAGAHARRGVADFQGYWTWETYTKDRNDLPPAYRNMPLKDTPRDSMGVTIRQRGSHLRGECGATARFLAMIEDTHFTTIATGNTARVRLLSDFGGHVTATITRRGPALVWKVIRSDGEEYFPQEAVLHRVLRRRRA